MKSHFQIKFHDMSKFISFWDMKLDMSARFFLSWVSRKQVQKKIKGIIQNTGNVFLANLLLFLYAYFSSQRVCNLIYLVAGCEQSLIAIT